MVRALKSIRLRDSVIITNLLISSALLWETCLEARPIWTTAYPSSERKKHRIIIEQADSKRMVQVNIKELVGAKLNPDNTKEKGATILLERVSCLLHNKVTQLSNSSLSLFLAAPIVAFASESLPCIVGIP